MFACAPTQEYQTVDNLTPNCLLAVECLSGRRIRIRYVNSLQYYVYVCVCGIHSCVRWKTHARTRVHAFKTNTFPAIGECVRNIYSRRRCASARLQFLGPVFRMTERPNGVNRTNRTKTLRV